MKRFVSILLLLALVLFNTFALESRVKIASNVSGDLVKHPDINISIGTAFVSSFGGASAKTVGGASTDTTEIEGINLADGGKYTFYISTNEEIFLKTASPAITIEIKAEGFHLYQSGYTGTMDGSEMEKAALIKENALPLNNGNPLIDIPTFSDQENENVYVSHDGNENTIKITFLPGLTKKDLILGSFDVSWNPTDELDVGVYKAKVSISYNTL
ncbi:MAG: hypothetical protein HUK24_05450 [Sphaerochaetaceae bacterium]|nr:hypothetical protein [Sphaerochaetaceae bacterium]